MYSSFVLLIFKTSHGLGHFESSVQGDFFWAFFHSSLAFLECCSWNWLREEFIKLLVRAHMLHFYEVDLFPLMCYGDVLQSLQEVYRDEAVMSSLMGPVGPVTQLHRGCRLRHHSNLVIFCIEELCCCGGPSLGRGGAFYILPY